MVLNDGWFPHLSIAAARDALRLDGTVTDQRLRDAMRYAIHSVNRQLAALRVALVAFPTMADADPVTIDGQSRLLMLYRRAVHCTAKADLIERYRDYDSTDSGLRRAEDLTASIDEMRRNANWAVRDMLGQPHTVVELI